MQVIRAAYRRWQVLVHELAKFGIVGAFCYAVDFGLSNLLHVGLGMGAMTAKGISTLVAATFAYFGNRHWSFRHRARSGVRREYSLFVVLTLVGLAITEACTGFGVHVLGQTSPLAYNIWSNLIGTGLATVFRFWAYKKYVFLHPEDPKVLDGTVPVVTERLPMPEPEPQRATRGSAA